MAKATVKQRVPNGDRERFIFSSSMEKNLQHGQRSASLSIRYIAILVPIFIWADQIANEAISLRADIYKNTVFKSKDIGNSQKKHRFRRSPAADFDYFLSPAYSSLQPLRFGSLSSRHIRQSPRRQLAAAD